MRNFPGVLLHTAYFIVVTACLLAAVVFASVRAYDAQTAGVVRMADSRVQVTPGTVRTFRPVPGTHYRQARPFRLAADAPV